MTKIIGIPLKKIGDLYVNDSTNRQFIRCNGKMEALVDPYCGGPLIRQEDGTYYSEYTDKIFTFEEGPNGEKTFFPAYLPYEGMDNIKAKVEGNRLVGENGIYLPIEGNKVITPFEEGLTTQEQINEEIEKDREKSREISEELQRKYDEGIESAKKEIADKLETVKQKEEEVKKINENIDQQHKQDIRKLEKIKEIGNYMRISIYRECISEIASFSNLPLESVIRKYFDGIEGVNLNPELKENGQPLTIDDYCPLPVLAEDISRQDIEEMRRKMDDFTLNKSTISPLTKNEEVIIENENAEHRMEELSKGELSKEKDTNEIGEN